MEARHASHSNPAESVVAIGNQNMPDLARRHEQELVSVILPAFNMARYIERTIDSALNQTHRNLEILVVDDGSTDETRDIVARLGAKDSRIRLLVQGNGGVAGARNAAIGASRGQFIAPLDADDLWHREKIERQLARFRQCKDEVALVYCASVLIDTEDYVVRRAVALDRFEFEGRVVPALIWRNFGCASVPLIRREALLAVGGYDQLPRRQGAEGCEDKDIYIRLAERWPFARIPYALVGHRMRLDGMSHNTRSMYRSHDLVISAARRRNPRLPGKLIRWSYARTNVALSLRATARKQYSSAFAFLLRALVLDPAYVLVSAVRLLNTRGEKLDDMWFIKESRKFSDRESPRLEPSSGRLSKRRQYISALCSHSDVDQPRGAQAVTVSAASVSP